MCLPCTWPWVQFPARKNKQKTRKVRVFGKFFPDRSGSGWQGCGVTTALNDTLCFGLLFSTEKPRGVVITVALWETEVPSGHALERHHAWYSVKLIRKPPEFMLYQSSRNSPGKVHCQKGSYFKFSNLDSWICWIK